MQQIFDLLNSARQIDANGVEFWDYYDLFHITFDICENRIYKRLPARVFECSGACPIFCSNDEYKKETYSPDFQTQKNMTERYYKVFFDTENYSYHCHGGKHPILEELMNRPVYGVQLTNKLAGENNLSQNIFLKHIKYYPTRNKIDFSYIDQINEKLVWIGRKKIDVPEINESIVSAKLSRFACYELLNQHLIQANNFDDFYSTLSVNDFRFTDINLGTDTQTMLLLYFMYPETDLGYLTNMISDLERIFARDKNRGLEKQFSGIIYNKCGGNFKEIRDAAKDTIFFEHGRPITTSKEPPANFYNADLLHSVNDAMNNVIGELTKKDDFGKSPRLKKNDVINIVKNEFNLARENLNSRDISPEDMFCRQSVKQLKSMFNKNERQFRAFYSKRTLLR